MKKFILVFVLAIVAMFISFNAAAQNNAATKTSSMMTPTEAHGVDIQQLKDKLTNIRLQIGVCKDVECEKKFWAENKKNEEELERSQVVCPEEGDWDFTGGEKDFRRGFVKNYNKGRDNIAVIYLSNINCTSKPVVIILGPGEEKSLSLYKGTYMGSILCGFYNQVFFAEIKGNDWIICSVTSASRLGVGDKYDLKLIWK